MGEHSTAASDPGATSLMNLERIAFIGAPYGSRHPCG